MDGWKILRQFPIKPEINLVALQKLIQEDPQQIKLFVSSGTLQSFHSSTSPLPTRTRISVIFLDAFRKCVVGNRGTFDFQYIELVYERDTDGTIKQDTITLFDSVEFTGGLAHRVLETPTFSSGSNITLRVFNIVEPEEARFVRVYYREV